MSDIMKAFQECLNSDLPCQEIIRKMNNLSKYKIIEGINEEEINTEFFTFCSRYFVEELTSFSKKEKFVACNRTIFKLSHQIVSKESIYKENKYFQQLKLFYQTFFFYEYSAENETNNFTFFIKLTEYLVEPKVYEIYLLNIGKIILGEKNDSKLVEILFSKDTPEFLKHIILVCFLYIRETIKDPLDFITLCVPSLNYFNLYYLSQGLKTKLEYHISQLREINYINFEKYLSNRKKLIEKEEKVEEVNVYENLINIKEKIENKISIISEEELSKYFCFPYEDYKNKISQLFKDDKLLKNKEKFFEMIKSINQKIETKYKIVYDNVEIDDKTINAFSFMFLLKYKLINKIDGHFFQIYNQGNIKIELFSFLLTKYLDSINKLLDNLLTDEQIKELFHNSGFYKFNSEYVFLITVDENEEKIFFLKHNLGKGNVTSINNDENFKIYEINLSDKSSIKESSEIEDFYVDGVELKALYNFGNYSFEKEIRTFIRNFIKNKNKVHELPRLYFLLNYAIPFSSDKYLFIKNVKSRINKRISYGFAELDFVLKNESTEDITIDNEFRPYKEQLFMNFPKDEITNNKKIIFKNKSIIFCEFKVSFPLINWKDNFTHLFKKIKNFIEIYKMRGLYTQELIQIFFIYDNMPDIYNIWEIKNFLVKNFSSVFSHFEFGIYYFTRGIGIINTEKELIDIKNESAKTKEITQGNSNELSNTIQNIFKDISRILDMTVDEKTKEELKKLKEKYKIDN